MEYININSLRTTSFSTPLEIRNQLLSKYNSTTNEDYIITTDQLELIRGNDLLESARQQGRVLLPLERASYIKPTVRFPKRVLLELTSNCNSDCTMCPRTVLTREEKHMDTKLSKDTIKQLAEVGLSGLWLYNIGESLLHPDFFEILEYCRKFDNLGTLWLSTNGSCLTDKMIEKILDNPVDILNFSVNAMSEEEYRKISPTLNFKKIHANLRKLLKQKKERNQTKPLIRAQMIEIPYVLHEIELFKKEYGRQVDIVSVNKLEVFSQNVDANNPDEIVLNTHIPKCNRLEREDFFIFSDGSVSCCDTDFNCTLNIGNVNHLSVQEIFEGKPYQGILKQYKQGQLHEQPLCSKCKDYNL